MDFIEEFARRGDKPALVFSGRLAISYAELDRRVGLVARELGAGKRLVAVEAEATEQAVIAYLAALKGGHAVALLPSGDSAAMEEFEAEFCPDVVLRRTDGRWRRIAGTHAEGGLNPDLALLLATSGSTGKSRYVRLSAQAVAANAGSIGEFLELHGDDRAALMLPLHYSYGLSVLNSHLAVGASVYFVKKGAAEPGFAEELRAAGCTNLAGVPYSYELMESTGFRAERLPALRFMTVAGGRIAPGLAETFRRHLATAGKRLFLMYGQTEATARIAYVPPESLASHCDSIGIAIPGGALRLIDEDGEPVMQPGEAGELVYRGPNVMMGYAECRVDLAGSAEIDELRTGDIATRDRHGFFRIVGRKKRFSKIAGLRINHEAIEHALAARGIAAAVTGDDSRLLAAVTSRPNGARPSEGDACRIIVEASGLTPLHVAVRQVETLPRLASGKVDLGAVSALFKSAPQSADEKVADIYRRAFYPRRVSPADSFDSLGGDSLLYVQLSFALERALGQAPHGWERMSIAELAALGPARSRWRMLDSELAVRALAILLIVVHHATLWPIPGGAATLMLLVGYGIARFQAKGLFAGKPGGMLRGLVTNLGLYVSILAGFAIARGEVPWPSLFLIGNLGIFDPADMLPYLYWFVEAYAQVVLVFAALFMLAPVRRIAKARPFPFGLAFLAAGVAAKFATPLVWNVGAAQIFTTPDVIYLAAFGWCVHFAKASWSRALTLGVAALVFPVMAYTGGNWVGSWVKFSLQLGVVAVLLYAPRLPAPRLLAGLVLPGAAASYHIYLFHRILPDLLLPQPDPLISAPVAATLAVASGIVTGLLVFALQKWLTGTLARRRPAIGPSLSPLRA